MMKNYFSALDSLFPDLGERAKILEAGCGEGEIAGHVLQKCTGQQTIEGFDISEKVILDAQKKYPEIRFSTGNIYEIAGGGYELVLCCEVLEHLDDPKGALKQIEKVSGRYMIVSVPREPVWRCLNIVRGKYLKAFGNTPGHIQHWSSKSFINFLMENGMKIKQIRKPLPWTMVLLEKM